MSTSRKIFYAFLFFSLFTVGLFAQRATPTISGDQELVKLLGLTPEQTEAIQVLEKETEAKMASLREAGASAREDAKAARQAHKRALGEILTEEQASELRTYRLDQRTARREARKAVDWQAMGAELKAFQETTVNPVLRTQRTKLDRKLSKEDRNTITAVREELAAIRSEQRANRQEKLEEGGDPAKGGAQAGRRGGRRGKGGAAGKMSADSRAVIEELATKYADDINGLFAEIKPQREQWEADRAVIRAKYLPENAGGKRGSTELEGGKLTQRNITFLLMKTE